MFSYSKIWQTDLPEVVLQIRQNREKQFLVISSCDILLNANKPEGVKSDLSFVTLFKKYCRKGRIESIQKSGYCYLITIRSLDLEFYIYIDQEKFIHFLNSDHESLVRISKKGSFTKKRTIVLPTDFVEYTLKKGGRKKEKVTIIPKALKRKLKTLKTSRKKTLLHLCSEQEIVLMKNKAKYLDEFSFRLKNGVSETVIEKSETGLVNDLHIELNSEKTIGQNIDSYYQKVKKMQTALKIQGERLSEIDSQIDHVDYLVQEWESLPVDLKEPFLKKGQKRDKKSSEVRKGFREFLIEGVRYCVGKSPKENDELTKKAKGNDLWVHVVDGGGSHVIVPGKFAGENKSQKIAGILALHFSKHKESRSGEVYLAKRSEIRKKKGLPAGLWLVDQCKTQFYRYTQEEVDFIFKGEIKP